MDRLVRLVIFTVFRFAFTRNLPMDWLGLLWNLLCGQFSIDFEITLWTGWLLLGIYTVYRIALTLNIPCGQVGFDLEFNL